MLWFKLALALITLVNSIIQALEKQGIINDAQRELLDRRLIAARSEIKLAEDVRSAVADELRTHPERVREPDKYSRS